MKRLTFKELVYNNVSFNNNNKDNISKYSSDTTKWIWDAKKSPNNIECADIPFKKIQKGKFYLLKYNFNGNKIWCPIFTLDFRVNNNKPILYAIQLEFIPYKFKVEIFNIIFKYLTSQLLKIESANTVFEELSLPVTFEQAYRILQGVNMQHSITAFDLNKIVKTYVFSTKMADRFIFCDTKKYNAKDMKTLYENLPDSPEKKKLKTLLEEYSKILEEYDEDNIEFFKKMKAIENHFKLIDEK